MLGGRAAELLVFGTPSTGASNDLERATDLARRMVTEFGMTEALGPVRYAAPMGANYLSAQLTLRPELSPDTTTLIDRETRRLVESAQEQAMNLLRTHRAALDEVARQLQERETISGEEIQQIVAEEQPSGSI